MKLIGSILEGATHPEFIGNSVSLLGEGQVFEIRENSLYCLYKRKNDFYATFKLGGLWVTQNNNTTKYIDIFNEKNFFPDLNFEQVRQLFLFKNMLVCNNSKTKEIILIDINTWDIQKIKYERISYPVSSNEYLYIRSNGCKIIKCYDSSLKLIWEYELEGNVYINFERKPQLHKNLVIINHAWYIIALNKHTGEEVWEFSFNSDGLIPSSNVLVNDKIYAVCEAIFYVINPDTGEIEWTKETGYENYCPDIGNVDRDINHICILPVGDYFYGIAEWSEKGEIIHLYDARMNLIYKTRLYDYVVLNHSLRPTIHDGKIYQTMSNQNSYSDVGVMVLEIMNDKIEHKIEPQTRPNVTMVASPNLKTTHKLQIFLEVNTLDDALRYGKLITNELHFATGYMVTYDLRKNALDTKHNGEIELVIDDTNFKESKNEIDEFLMDFEEKQKENLSSNAHLAGDKKTPITFKLIRQPKKDWNKSGEQLDWPAIREQTTPLS